MHCKFLAYAMDSPAAYIPKLREGTHLSVVSLEEPVFWCTSAIQSFDN